MSILNRVLKVNQKKREKIIAKSANVFQKNAEQKIRARKKVGLINKNKEKFGDLDSNSRKIGKQSKMGKQKKSSSKHTVDF
jgi:hypothetical protein